MTTTTNRRPVISVMRHRAVRSLTTRQAPPSELPSSGTTPTKALALSSWLGSGDAFLHVSVVERSGHDSVPPGATLEVRAGPGSKGPQVTEILSVDASPTSPEPPRRPRPERSAYSPRPAFPAADRTTVE